MSGICKATGAITSDAQLTIAFPVEESILPPMNTTRIDSGELKGRLPQEKLESIYNGLVASNKLVSNSDYKQKLSTLGDKNMSNDRAQQILTSLGATESATMGKIKEEYCYYYVRYKYALETLFDKLVMTSKKTSLSKDDKDDIQNKLDRAKMFNTKLNDMIQITNYIAQKRASEMREQNSEINAMNASIGTTFQTLQDHAKMLSSENSIADLRKRMVEYTEEKNRSALNLLSLYGFLNLVAIGLLFYIARS